MKKIRTQTAPHIFSEDRARTEAVARQILFGGVRESDMGFFTAMPDSGVSATANALWDKNPAGAASALLRFPE